MPPVGIEPAHSFLRARLLTVACACACCTGETRVKGKRSLLDNTSPGIDRDDLLKHLDQEEEYARVMSTLNDKLIGIPSPAKRQQIKETKAFLLPHDYQKAMVAGGFHTDWFESPEFDEEIIKACEKAEAKREADMDAELWRVCDEAEINSLKEQDARTKKLEKEVVAAEKAYSDAQEARKRAYKALGEVKQDDGLGVGFHL